MRNIFWMAGLAMCGTALAVCSVSASTTTRSSIEAAPKEGVAKKGVTSRHSKSGPATYGLWHSCEIGGGGFVQNIVPTSNPNIYYAYVDVGGAYRSDDGGKRWHMIHGGLPSANGAMYNLRGLSVNPSNPNDILVAGGTQWAPEAGLYHSLDGGRTWKKALSAHFYGNEDFRWAGTVFARNPKNAAQIWAASGGDGLFVSNDLGATWKQAGLRNQYFCDLKFDRSNPKRLWASSQAIKLWRDQDYVELKGGFFLSEDGGVHWVRLGEQSPSEIVQDSQSSNTLYGVFDGRKISRSLDGGTTWNSFSAGLPIDETKAPDYTSEQGFNALATGPNFVLAASTRGTFYRLNVGQTHWQKIERQHITENYEGQLWHGAMAPGKWQHFGASLSSITVDPCNPNHWFFTDWFGIYQTGDGGKSWNLSMDGVETTVLHTLVVDPNDSGVVHLGMADNGYFLSENGGTRFQKPDGPSNCKSIALAPSLSRRIYATGDRGDGSWRANQVWVSIDRGRSWTRSPMIGLPDMGNFSCNSIAVSPDDAFTVYLGVSQGVKSGEGGVYKSSDGGKSWSWIGQGLPLGANLFAHNIWGIGREIVASKHGVLCAISRDAKAAYWYDGQKWTLGRQFGGQPMSVVAGADDTFFVGVRDEGVYRATQDGQRWDLVWKGDTAHVAVDAADPQHIAAGVNEGVILSLDGGKSWKMMDESLPYKMNPVVALSHDRLYAGTFGSGAFWMPLSPKGRSLFVSRSWDATHTETTLKETTQTNLQTKPLAILTNGSMTAGNTIPEGWELWVGSGTPVLSRDTQNFQAGPASLRLEGGVNAYGAASHALTLTKSPFVVSGYLKTTAGIEESNVAIRVVDNEGKQIDWISLFSGPIQNWTHWEKSVTLPDNAASASLTTTIKGNGTVWLDELDARLAPEIWKFAEATEANSPTRPSATISLENGEMTAGDTTPAGWSQGWTASGQLALTRDTNDFKSAPASLRLETLSAPAQGGASTPLKGLGAFKLSGQVKATGKLEEVLIAVQSFTAQGQQAGWTTLCDVKDKNEWTAFSGGGSLPDNAVSAQVVLILKGNGKVWLDDLKSE